MQRRPHRSFRATSRHDIPRGPSMPYLIPFTVEVLDVLWRFKKYTALTILLYITISIGLVGLIDQNKFVDTAELFDEIGGTVVAGEYDSTVRTLGLFGATVTGALNQAPTETQQLYLVLLYLFTWLVVVWMLRQLLAGHAIRFRDALYNAGAPFLSTGLIGLVTVLQLVPFAVAALVYSAAFQAEFISGVSAMLTGGALIAVSLLTLYWISGTFFAGVIVTNQGTYPGTALRAAGDIAFGRRVKLMIRLLWLAFFIVAMWIVFFLPALYLAQFSWAQSIPIVPIVAQILFALTVIFSAAYVYLLYRRLIDDPEK